MFGFPIVEFKECHGKDFEDFCRWHETGTWMANVEPQLPPLVNDSDDEHNDIYEIVESEDEAVDSFGRVDVWTS